tara:strand:- start:196 stop:1011 length:816 start_codon:yes stop_codon:yes gene_type:complete
MNINLLKSKSKEMRKKIFSKFYLLKEGHPGSVMSLMDILIVLYYAGFVRPNRVNRKYPFKDDIIVSKGHATVGQYPILHDLKVITSSDWNNWGRNKKTCLRMFGNSTIPGIKTATGSLGHGIGFGTGIAFSAKKNKVDKKVYVIISEGELYEGSTWESLLLLSSLKLNNIFIILDINNNIILGNPKKCLDLGNIKKKFSSFDFKVETCNGHNFSEIYKKLKKLEKSKKPSCLIANTIKGKGFKIMENKPNWHYWNNISKDTYDKSLLLLNK